MREFPGVALVLDFCHMLTRQFKRKETANTESIDVLCSNLIWAEHKKLLLHLAFKSCAKYPWWPMCYIGNYAWKGILKYIVSAVQVGTMQIHSYISFWAKRQIRRQGSTWILPLEIIKNLIIVDTSLSLRTPLSLIVEDLEFRGHSFCNWL